VVLDTKGDRPGRSMPLVTRAIVRTVGAGELSRTRSVIYCEELRLAALRPSAKNAATASVSVSSSA
jgi:hypothetical protein